MAKSRRSDRWLKRFVTDISGELVNGAAPGTFDDGVSICSYVSRQHGIELTVEEGGRIRELLDEQDRTNG